MRWVEEWEEFRGERSWGDRGFEEWEIGSLGKLGYLEMKISEKNGIEKNGKEME